MPSLDTALSGLSKPSKKSKARPMLASAAKKASFEMKKVK